MIISHKHKFIFVKMGKAAGSSIESYLYKYCGSEDVITYVSRSGEWDSDEIDQQPQNNKGCRPHMFPGDIQNKFPDFWENYFKFVVVRNPWDQAVSNYWWDMREENNISFSEWLRQDIEGFACYSNWLFMEEQPYADYYIRYENLENDFEAVCNILGIPSGSLPQTKNRIRKTKEYKEMYDEETHNIIREKNKKTIDFFGYVFK